MSSAAGNATHWPASNNPSSTESEPLIRADTSPDSSPRGHAPNTTDSPRHSDDEARASSPNGSVPPIRLAPPRRQSSFAQPRPDGARRTSNRVHFAETTHALSPVISKSENAAGEGNGQPRGSSDSGDWLELDDEDYLTNGHGGGSGGGDDRVARRPLLTGIEAPSVTLANEVDDETTLSELLRRPKSSLWSGCMNMANSIIGAGIIGQPYALRQAGLVAGLTLLVLLTVTVDWTIRLIVTNSKLSGASSFQATVEHCYGKSGLIAISVAQWAFAFGGMVAFCIIIGDTIPHVFASAFPSLKTMNFLWLLTDRRAIIVLFTLAISYPLSLFRDIAKLAKASTLALFSMLIILITVLTQGPREPAEAKGPIKGNIFIHSGIFKAIGVISFAFVCHHNSLLIYGSLHKPTMDRFARVTHISTSVSCMACIVMALTGYLNFGSMTKGNILNNFSSDNIMVNVARFCFGLNMLTTLPLEAFVCREVMTLYWFAHEPWEPTRHLIFTTALVVAAMTLSLFTCDLGVVFELVGATSACALAYILPPLCYVKLSKKRTWERYAAYGCVVFGCTVMVISVVQAVADVVRNEGGPKTCS